MSGESLSLCFSESFLSRAEKTAIVFLRGGRKETGMTYGALDRDAGRMAGVFQRMGVSRGDRVILSLEKSLIQVVAYLGLLKAGAIAVPLNPGFKKSETAYLAGDAEPSLTIAGPRQAALFREIDTRLKVLEVDPASSYDASGLLFPGTGGMAPVEVGPGDPALIIYTSGTTGPPKGAVLTHGNLIHDARNIIRLWEISEKDALCHALPLFHVHGLCFALHTALLAGARILMLDAFDSRQVIRAMADKEAEDAGTVFMAVPSMYAKLMNDLEGKNLDFDPVRLWTCGSAPLLPKDFARMTRVFGKEPLEREGMSETGMNFSNPLQGTRKPGSIGLPAPGLEVRLVDPHTLSDKAPGETGEIWLKGPGVTPGYWRKPAETAKAFVEGWFRTGDLGKVDKEGYYYLTDRIKHIIISGGENISPKEVEAVINGIDGVAESTVVGVPDERWGEKVVAAVVALPGSRVTIQDVKETCRERLHDWKCPKEVVFLPALPKNTMGKVLKEEVKKCFGP